MGLLNNLWKGADFWDKEENARQRAETVRTAQKAPPGQTVSADAQNKIRNAKYGVLANNPKRQKSFIGSLSVDIPKPFNPITEAPKVIAKESLPTIGAGIGRSLTGAAEGASGLVDLATPGTGTSRVTKGLVNKGAEIDQYVKKNNFSPLGYKIAQATTDVGSFLAPGAVAKGVQYGAKAGGTVGKVGKTLSSTAPIINKPIVKYGSSPSALLNAGVGTVRSQGYVASREQDVNPQTIAMGAGASLALGGAAGAFGAKAVDPLSRTKLVQNTNQAVSKAVTKPQVPEDLTQKRIGLMTARSNAEVRNKTGLIPTIDSQISRVDQQIKQATTRPIMKPFSDQAGFVKVPGGEDYADLSPKQREFINDYANMIEDMGSGNGVNITPDGRRISNNFRTAENQGKAMTKTDWFDQARSDIESGKAGYGASEDYKNIPGVTKPTLQDALEGKSTKIPRSQLTGRALDVPSRDPIADALGMDAKTLKEAQDFTNADASRPADFGAIAGASNSKNSNKLAQAINESDEINQAAIKAQEDGKEINFFAKKDKNGRSVGVERFNPKYHKIESGFVMDKDGKVLGNHIKVDDTGVQVNVGGDLVNMDSILGSQARWRGDYKVSETMDRNIKNNAPDEATYKKTRNFVIDNKTKNEALFKEELQAQRNALQDRAKATQAARPSNVSKDEYNADVFDFIENKLGTGDLKAKYGDSAQQIIEYKAETRKLYDDLLDRVNTVFAKYGEAQVPKRKDYITHINELMNKPNFAGEMFGQLQNSILGEGMQTTRGSVPSNIAGRTENFEPRKKWNRFFQQRKGDDFTKDPFKAVDAYLEPTLYNIHMTEPAVRARAVEAAFRTGSELKQMDKTGVSEALLEELEKYGGANSKLVTGFQEYANALAGKTQRWDRQIVDSSDAAASTLRGWQGLQRIGGRATILGNVQSIVAQSLNQPLALAQAGAKNYLKGVGSSLSGSTPIKESPFIRARRIQANSPFRSKGAKVLDAGGVPLRKVELAMVEQTWNSNYHRAAEQGLSGQKAILEADRMTEQVVAGRGIADMPEMYRSTTANGLLQYTLEVAATNKKFWQDLTPVQKAKYVAAVFATNQVVGAVTGYQPLPDFLGATIDTAKDFAEDDGDTAGEKTVDAAQRFASAGVAMNPVTSAGANIFLNQNQRKTIFGEDSNLARFEGTAAPVQVVRNAVDAGLDVAKGNLTGARDNILRTVPFGNQARKTITGAETIARGYAVDGNGNPTFAGPQSIGGKAQTLIFGPSSTADAKRFYSDNSKSITGKGDKAVIASSSDKRKAVSDIQARRDGEAVNGVTDKATIVKQAFNTPEAQAFFAQTEDQQKAQASNDPKLYELMKQKDAMQKALGTPTLNPSLSDDDKKVLTKADRLTQKAEDAVSNRQKDYDYKKLVANYNKDKAEGNITEEEDIKRQKAIKKAEVGSQFDKNTRKLYEMSKTDLEKHLKDHPDGKRIYEQIVAYDKALVDSEYHKTLKFKYGLSSGKGGKKGRKGRKAKLADKSLVSLFPKGFDSASSNKKLRDILKQARLS